MTRCPALRKDDLVVGAGVDVGVDPQRARRPQAARRRDGRNLGAFFLGFEVELADAGIEPLGQLARGLADTREDDVLRRHARRQRTRQLAA